MRCSVNRLSVFALLLLMGLPNLAAAWPPGGVVVAPVPDRGQGEPHVLLGRQGSVLAFWSDFRWLDGSNDLYGQLLTHDGRVAPGWPDTGLMIARAADDQRPVAGLSHPDGSFIVGIADFRDYSSGNGVDAYLTRVQPDGRIDSAWPRHGFQAIDRPGDNTPARMKWVAPDTLVICCGYTEPGIDLPIGLLFQKVAVTPAGPQAVWGSAGLVYQWRPSTVYTTGELVPDGAGGVFVVFDEFTSLIETNLQADLYVMRLGRDGLPAAGWESGARPLCVAPGLQEFAIACGDGAGGLYVTWADERDGSGLPYPDDLQYEDIRLLRLTAEGTPYPGWPADGLLVSGAAGWQFLPNLLPDGRGGVYVSFDDLTIGVTRVRGDGTFAPGWAQNGIQVSSLVVYATNSRMVLDALGGAYVLFEDVSNNDLYLQHVLGGGIVDPSWPSTGYKVGKSSDGDIVSDGAGGCYVTGLTQLVPFGLPVVAVNRYGIDGVVPVKLAEGTAETEPGRVRLVWRGAEASATEARVQRRGGRGGEWQVLGVPTPRGRDELAYDDLTAEAGASYDYRLVRGAEVLSEEISVQVPAAAVFALAGATPNPSLARELTVAFSLTGSGPASLEVLDLAGRREYARALSGLAPGHHALPLAEASLPPGVHWLRLSEGARSAHARMVVVR